MLSILPVLRVIKNARPPSDARMISRLEQLIFGYQLLRLLNQLQYEQPEKSKQQKQPEQATRIISHGKDLSQLKRGQPCIMAVIEWNLTLEEIRTLAYDELIVRLDEFGEGLQSATSTVTAPPPDALATVRFAAVFESNQPTIATIYNSTTLRESVSGPRDAWLDVLTKVRSSKGNKIHALTKENDKKVSVIEIVEELEYQQVIAKLPIAVLLDRIDPPDTTKQPMKAADVKAQLHRVKAFCDKKFDVAQYDAIIYYSDIGLRFSDSKYQTRYSIVNDDTLTVAKMLRDTMTDEEKARERILVMNAANTFYAGGGVEDGKRAQEECLYLRSNYYQCTYKSHVTTKDTQSRVGRHHYEHPIPEFGSYYTPLLEVVSDSYYGDFREYNDEERFSVAALAVAAYNLGRIEKERIVDGKAYLTREAQFATASLNLQEKLDIARKGMETKITHFLRVAVARNHHYLVLCAAGCGAFAPQKNQYLLDFDADSIIWASEMCAIFKKILLSDEFRGRFAHVVFGVLDTTLKRTNIIEFEKLVQELRDG